MLVPRTISGGSADRTNGGCVAVFSFAEPAPSQGFRQNPTSSADNFLQKQQKQRGVPCFFRRRDGLRVPPGGIGPLHRSPSGVSAPVPPLMWCEAGWLDAEPATEAKRSAT
jgi:hypothetical protein